PALQQLDQVLAGIALAADRLDIVAAQLPFGHRTVVALEALLGHELQAVVGRLLATLAMLAGTIFALVDRGLRTAPQVDPEAAVDLVLRIRAFAHAMLLLLCCVRIGLGPAHGLGRDEGPIDPQPRSPEEARNILAKPRQSSRRYHCRIKGLDLDQYHLMGDFGRLFEH